MVRLVEITSLLKGKRASLRSVHVSNWLFVDCVFRLYRRNGHFSKDILLQKAYGAVPTNQTALLAKDGKETCADQLQFCITSIVLRREKAFRKELKTTSSKSVLVERSHVGSLLVMCRCYQKLPKVKQHEVRNDKQQKDVSLNGELAKQVTTQHAYIDRLRVNNNN